MRISCWEMLKIQVFFSFTWKSSSSSSWLDKTVSVWSERPWSIGPALCKIPSDCPSGACVRASLTRARSWRPVLPSQFPNRQSHCGKKEKASVGASARCAKSSRRAASPLFYEQLAVALPSLLVDRVKVQYDQTDDGEKDGSGGNQHFQG